MKIVQTKMLLFMLILDKRKDGKSIIFEIIFYCFENQFHRKHIFFFDQIKNVCIKKCEIQMSS
jgi:hypothetical protein